MKTILSILFTLVIISTVKAQSKGEKSLAAAVETFKLAVISADHNLLESITADQLVYGHSSGKVQNKMEFVEEIVSGKPLDYITIELSNQTMKFSGKTAVVRHIFSSEITNAGVPGNLKIGNMLIWQKQHGKWKLLARQAYKI
ncbi:MAG: hypothetical protein JWN56_1087 [Sphingobacteriales bacterium]|nr:hypothetical protein [Sphingobacteriales bacterium]